MSVNYMGVFGICMFSISDPFLLFVMAFLFVAGCAGLITAHRACERTVSSRCRTWILLENLIGIDLGEKEEQLAKQRI